MNFDSFWTDLDGVPDSEIMHRVLTGVRSIEDFKPSSDLFPLLEDPTEYARILDFGAGLLRNTIGMIEFAPLWNVVAFDNQTMLDRGQKLFGLEPEQSNVNLASDWHQLHYSPFDSVLASLVFQHIKPDTLAVYLADLKNMTPRLVVLSRFTFDDLSTPVWPTIGRYFEPEEGYELPSSGSYVDHHVVVLKPRS